MADSDFQVHLCSKGDLGQVLDFSRRLRKVNIKVLPLEKNYYLSRYSKESKRDLTLFLLKHKNKIVGCSGYVFFKGFFKDKYIDVIIYSDLVIDPACNKRFPAALASLYTSYRKFIFQGKLFLCFSEKSTIDKYKFLGWDEFTALYQLRHSFFSGIAYKLKPSLEFRVITCFNREISSFFKKVAEKHGVLVYPDTGLLNRRYFLNPFRPGLALAGYKNNKIIGYVAAEKAGTNIYVTGLSVDLAYREKILFLLAEVFKRLKGNENTYLNCFLSHAKYIEILKKFRFYPLRKMPCLYLKRFNKGDLFSPCGNLCHIDVGGEVI